MTERGRFTDALLRAAPPGSITVPQAEQCYDHYVLLLRWNPKLNLTRITDVDEAVERHYAEACFLHANVSSEFVSFADVGSGGGYPGIPLAILRPASRVLLVESHVRKSVFLREASRRLPNVEVRAARAEELRDNVGCIVSRAVAWPEVLRCVPRLSNCVALLLGGADAEEAMASKRLDWDRLLELPYGDHRVLLTGRVPRGT